MFTLRIDSEYAGEVTPHLARHATKRGVRVSTIVEDRDPEYTWFSVYEYDEDQEGYIEDLLNDLPTSIVELV